MPRLGLRPYECVRRAWHSDTHQPIRGSIIQQIFRVVNDTHCPATRKNREWQEKLPIVVLRAEEILYSKANSETEYSNLETLWDRVIDAVNTIIRRDESSETGELLPPCIEAALNLGCVPVRASRSQQQSNPRSYLRPQESISQTPKVFDKASSMWPQQLPFHCGNKLSFECGPTVQNLTCPFVESNNYLSEDGNLVACHGYPVRYESIPPGPNALMAKGSAYPFYYGNCCLPEEEVQENTNLKTIIVGKPVRPVPGPSEMGVLKNLFPCSSSELGYKRARREEGNEPTGLQCDLSLRLGLSADTCFSGSHARENEDFHSRCRGKVNDCPPENNTEFQYIVGRMTNDPWNFCSYKRSYTGEHLNSAVTFRKHKELFGDNVKDRQFYWSEPV